MGADEGFKNDLDKQIKNLNLEKKVTFTGYLQVMTSFRVLLTQKLLFKPHVMNKVQAL